MTTTNPTPRTWTIKFKHNRNTILLYLDPSQKLSSVRDELLKALQQTNPEGSLNNHRIPDSSDDILLAKPVDVNDLTAGWEPIGGNDLDGGLFDEEEDGNTGRGKARSKGKGKAAIGKTSKSRNDTEDTPQSLGLRDGGVLAFKFRGKSSSADELEGEDASMVIENEAWDVITPRLEDLYGDEEDGGPVDADANDDVKI